MLHGRLLFEAKLASHEKTAYKLIFHAAHKNLLFENKAQTPVEVGLENGPLGLQFLKWPEGCIFYSSYLEHQINNSGAWTSADNVRVCFACMSSASVDLRMKFDKI